MPKNSFLMGAHAEAIYIRRTMSRPLNHRQIEAFRAVMQAGTATGAAALLHTTQPSVSRLLAQVQAATGLKLFDLQRGRLRPTPEARLLNEAVQRRFQAMESIEQTVAALRRQGAGLVRVGCTPSLSLSLLPRAIAKFRQAHPDVRVAVQTATTPALVEGLLHGLHDLILSTTPMQGEHIEARVLHRSHAVCVLAPGHRLAARATLHARDLQREDLLCLNADDEIQLQVQRLLRAQGLELPPAAVESTYSFTLCRLAAEGLGVGIVNPYIASVFAQDLRIVPLSPRCPVQAVLAFSALTAPSAMAERFVADLGDAFRSWVLS